MQTKFHILNKLSKLAIATVAAIAVSACAPRVSTHGNLPDPDLLANIEIDRVNKRQVVDLIGSPSTIELFQGENWYYISDRTETKAFFEPTVIERKVIVIKFDKKGIVKAMKTIGLKEGRDIAMVERVTPTSGQEITILRQLLGNIGRFGGNNTKTGTILDE